MDRNDNMLKLFCPAESLASIMTNDQRTENSFKFKMTQVHQRLPSVNKPFEELFQDDPKQLHFFTVANNMRRENILTDIDLMIDQQLFPAHKIVLSAMSDYFMTMFNGPLAACDRHVTLIGLTPEVMDTILNYIYSGTICINEENIQDILEASCLLLLTRLRDRCGKFLRDRLDMDNCLQIFSVAKKYSLQNLLECSLEFISAIFQDLTTHPDFLRLSTDELIDIITLEDLAVPSEDHVLEAALIWLRYDSFKREKDFVEVLKALHLPFVSDVLLNRLIDTEFIFRTNTNLASVFRSALKLTLQNWRSNDETDFKLLEPKSWCNPRKCIQCIPSIIAMGGPTLNLFNSELGKWCEVTKCKPRHCPGMDVIGSSIYIVGGSLEWKRKQTGEYFNTETNEWCSIANMHTPRSNFGLVLLKGKLYALGGYDGNFPLKSSEVYNPKDDSWSKIANMNYARDGACNASDGESVYVIGGYDGNQYLLSTEIYQLETGEWDISTTPPMSQKRQNAMCAYYNSRIYIIGGYFDDIYHSTMEVLDLETSQWSSLSQLSEPRHYAGASAVNGHLFICGGWSSNTPVSHVDVYSIEQDTWQRVAPLPTPTMIRCVSVNFPRKSMLNLFSDNSDEMVAYRTARLRSLRTFSESSSTNERSGGGSEEESFLTSSNEETCH